jgi:hypothetical protein
MHRPWRILIAVSCLVILTVPSAAAQSRAPVPLSVDRSAGGVTTSNECPDVFIEGYTAEDLTDETVSIGWLPVSQLDSSTYEIVRRSGSAWCAVRQDGNFTESIISTTGTRAVVSLAGPDQVNVIHVRVAGCPTITTRFAWGIDTWRTPPEPAPSLRLGSVSGRLVTLVTQKQEDRAVFLLIGRQGPGEPEFTAIAQFEPRDYCPVGREIGFTDDLTGRPDGTYRYIAVARASRGFHASSSPVEVTVGAQPLPRISFDASPGQIRRGESARLVWSTADATSVSIDRGVGSQPVRGSASVAPTSTTTYTLSATGPGGTATAQTTIEVITTPEVALTALPQQMVQGTGAGGAETIYVLTNVGGASTSITLTQQGDFFTQSPTSFSIAPGQSQRVTITALQRDTGSFRGTSIVSGNGVPPGTTVPIQLLAVPTPDGPTAAEPENARVDLSAPEGTNPTGTARFRNTGEAKIQGTLVATVPWIIPQPGLIEVDPGQTVTVTFTIDRAMRPPNADIGSLEGKLMLVFRTGPGGKSGGVGPHSGAASSSSVVTVVDTSTPPVQPGVIPPLAPGEIALFIPGAGHVEGGAGLFFSDIALINLSGQQTLNSIDLYYTPSAAGSATSKASVSGLVAGTPMALADVVRTVFEAEATLGSLQVRAPNIQQLSVNANILLRTREETPRTFGNTIPALRSDRSVAAGESFFLTGLKKSETSHTNLFIQETSGGAVTADIEFFDAGGTKLGERNGVTAGAFQLTGLFDSPANPVLPGGAVSAVITSRPESTGRFAAYATPVDKRSGDSWSLVDWNAQSGFAGGAEMVIPVAGALRGANNLNFRTDVSVINRGTGQASGILRYIPQPDENREPMDRTIALGPRQSSILEDVTTTLFGLDPTQFTLGFMKFLPQTGEVTVTSRNFATAGDDPGTFGTGVATLGPQGSLRLGEVRRIGGVRDAALASIQQKVPGSFRSNFGIMETSGVAPVTVRVTVHFTFSGGTKAVARGTGSREYTLQPNAFLQLSRVSREVLGATRDDFGDFDNLQVDFAVVAGDGAAAVYVSSVENDTGDSILRVD